MDAVEAAFAAHPRAGFLPRKVRARASHDGPLPIAAGQTNSQPRTVADMLRLLDVRPGHRVLDVGTGSGWTTALLAHVVGATGEVVGVELEPELVAFGAANLAATGQPWARIEQARAGVAGRARSVRRTTGSWSRRKPGTCPTSSSVSSPTPASWSSRCAAPCCGSPTRGGFVSEHGRYRFVPLRT